MTAIPPKRPDGDPADDTTRLEELEAELASIEAVVAEVDALERPPVPERRSD